MTLDHDKIAAAQFNQIWGTAAASKIAQLRSCASCWRPITLNRARKPAVLLFMLTAVCAAQVIITEFPVSGFPPSAGLSGITGGPDGGIWFVMVDGTVVRSTTSGAITKIPFPINARDCCTFSGITSGPDGNLWFTKKDGIVRVTTSGLVTEFPVRLDTNCLDRGITPGPDGNVWFTEPSGKIGRITPPGPWDGESGSGQIRLPKIH